MKKGWVYTAECLTQSLVGVGSNSQDREELLLS